MKCRKHGCEMEERETTIGWGNASQPVCPECEAERAGDYVCVSGARVYPAAEAQG